MAYWRNSDGLDVRFGTDEARDTSAIAQYNDAARMPKKYLTLDVDWDWILVMALTRSGWARE